MKVKREGVEDEPVRRGGGRYAPWKQVGGVGGSGRSAEPEGQLSGLRSCSFRNHNPNTLLRSLGRQGLCL